MRACEQRATVVARHSVPPLCDGSLVRLCWQAGWLARLQFRRLIRSQVAFTSVCAAACSETRLIAARVPLRIAALICKKNARFARGHKTSHGEQASPEKAQ